MPTRAEVIAAKIRQYDAQITGLQDAVADSAIAKLAIAQMVDASFGGGGGGGGGTSPLAVSDGIDQSIDIGTIIARLVDLVAKPNPPTQADIVAAIQTAADIDTLIARLISIDGRLIDFVATNKPVQAAITQIDGFIAAANSSQQALPSFPARIGWEIFNPGSSVFYIGVGVAAAISRGIPVLPNGAYSSPTAFLSTSQINIIGSTAGQPYTVISY